MPHYEFICAKGHEIEKRFSSYQAMMDWMNLVGLCPICGLSLVKKISQVSVKFKGEGWTGKGMKPSEEGKK
jgi:predicted nucleic acid-binding Zn ribbon protein